MINILGGYVSLGGEVLEAQNALRVETFPEMVRRLGEVHEEWDRRMCVLAARLYLGIDREDQYQAGIMEHANGTPLLSQSEFRAITMAW